MSSPATSRHAEAGSPALVAQRQTIARLEAALWEGGFNEKHLPAYQAAWRHLENLMAATGNPDPRHGFLLVIPVADSPRHLATCLDSLLALCEAYGYGGRTAAGQWRKLSVLLADDSAEAAALARHRALADDYRARGLRIHYFGPGEQMALLDGLAHLDLTPVVGHHARPGFGHKGQAMMRNIAYLQVAAMAEAESRALGGPLLCYTLDADQTFQVKVATAAGDAQVAALSFFHQMDAIFQDASVRVLTGKVVGDPPVSPAVMAGNFLDDVLAFLAEMAHTEAGLPYPRHIASTRGSGEAAYHDMADLFGFRAGGETYRFRCGLAGEPDNAACFADFARRLNRFFHGEHPTRVTYYRHEDALASLAPARTVYTGNYVFRPDALDWFIPYAPLRLRMSGPTMGRLLKAELGDGFVAANLPMLHRRTLDDTGQSEFRPGVVDRDALVDLSDEFERQFHGDVLLFAMERLTARGYPASPLEEATVRTVLADTRADMARRYRDKQAAMLARLARLDSVLDDPGHWWNQNGQHREAVARFRTFADNLARNFGPRALAQALLDDPQRLATWQARQMDAILNLPRHRQTWRQALARLTPPPGGKVVEGGTLV
ncbi:MAG: hypothetical protein AB1899_02025 [Pseudomonadota bacterium]